MTIGAIIIQQGNLNDIDWVKEQESDEELKINKEWKIKGTYPPESEIKKMNIETQRYFQIRDNIVIDPRTNIMLYEKMPNEHPEIDKYRILLPKSKQTEVIRRFHKMPTEAHLSATKTASKLLNHFWMPRIFTPTRNISQYV